MQTLEHYVQANRYQSFDSSRDPPRPVELSQEPLVVLYSNSIIRKSISASVLPECNHGFVLPVGIH